MMQLAKSALSKTEGVELLDSSSSLLQTVSDSRQ